MSSKETLSNETLTKMQQEELDTDSDLNEFNNEDAELMYEDKGLIQNGG